MGTKVRLAVVMDPIAHIKYVKDTTFAMLLAAQARGWSLHYLEPADLRLRDGLAEGHDRSPWCVAAYMQALDEPCQPHRGMAPARAQARHDQHAIVVRRADFRAAVQLRLARRRIVQQPGQLDRQPLLALEGPPEFLHVLGVHAHDPVFTQRFVGGDAHDAHRAAYPIPEESST